VREYGPIGLWFNNTDIWAKLMDMAVDWSSSHLIGWAYWALLVCPPTSKQVHKIGMRFLKKKKEKQMTRTLASQFFIHESYVSVEVSYRLRINVIIKGQF
jgi:hypothetical protein